MDELIYILLIVAWIAYSIYNAKQKKKQKEQTRKPSTEPQPQYETAEPQKSQRSILEELFGETDFEIIEDDEEEPVVQENIPQQKPAPVFAEHAHIRQAAESEYKIVSRLTDQMKGLEIADEIADEHTTYATEFDLRKAVIYSVILERPYH